MNDRISTGFSGFDKVIDYLRLGDNVVWQVDSVSDYKEIIAPYVKKLLKKNVRLSIYALQTMNPFWKKIKILK